MPPLSLAVFWHQHQPYYPDDVAGENPMPWVRLHGTKDYIGMAMHLDEVPEFHCTINLVPSLLTQILAYTDHAASDQHLDISRADADGLAEADAIYLLDHFFMANHESMIRPYKRYAELLDKRDPDTATAPQTLRRFSTADLRDLQVWNNLTWFHELLFEQNAELRAFRDKGRGWSEDEKQWLLDQQLEVLRQIIPSHKKLADRGQVELTTTPFFHPILPLLFDKRSAREAMPHCLLPAHLDSYEDDAREHLRRAIEFHTELFGTAPVGMWPSEGSVSHAILPAIGECGIDWIATDEEILAASTSGEVSRDSSGRVTRPELLYQPWKVEAADTELNVIFRDHAMSDLIGFHYQRMRPDRAAEDLIHKLESINSAVAKRTDQPAFVPIILDGENCWEYYPDGGVKFLRSLYQKCASHRQIQPTTVSEHLRSHPPQNSISRLFAGSWISHNFAIWIGHQEDNDGWDRLHEAREFLKEKEPTVEDLDALRRAWDELYIAEGSDWFWWYGDDHSSEQDALFDRLFRKHLKNIYALLGETPPARLDEPISASRPRQIHTQPRELLDVHINGNPTYFEWIAAGHYVAGSERGTMTMVTDGLIREMWFGFDESRFLLRCDTANRAVDDLRAVDALVVRFADPADVVVRIDSPARDGAATGSDAEFACERVFELAIPRDALGVGAGDTVMFSVELIRDEQSVEQIPAEGLIRLPVPAAEFDRMMWQV